MFGKIRSAVGSFFAARKLSADRATVSALLNDPRFEFRKINTLARKIGTTDLTYLHGILDSIGVRGMYGNPDMVGAIERVGERPRRYSDLAAS